MTEEQPGQDFWKRADEVIHLANEQRTADGNHKVGASLLYAAARFNAFVAASSAEDVEEMKADRDEALEYFCDEFRKALVENFDDYIANYKEYIEKFRHS
jgi:superfamily I DNA and RNA helicase